MKLVKQVRFGNVVPTPFAWPRSPFGPQGGGLLIISAPILNWDDETADATPDFTCTLVDPVAGDTLTLQLYSDAGLTTLVDSDVNVLDAGEVTAAECTFTLGALSAGTYYARVLAERTDWSSAYSNTETVTIITAGDRYLQEDGSSSFLQEDGTSFLLQESA